MGKFTIGAKGRQLHVVDVENLIGGPFFSSTEVNRLRRDYASATAMAPLAQVVVGASADQSAVASGIGWPGSGLRLQRGRDGADLALIEVLRNEAVADRFDDVFIGSGDGIFTDPAALLAAAGACVTVVSRRDALSYSLRMAATRVIYLDLPDLAASATWLAA